MSVEYAFVSACRDKRVNNCPEVATNVPGQVALRDSERPDEIVTMSTGGWAMLRAAIQAGEYDL
ncbi:DUF397 domain-containing protein [Streptomyces sp. NPDC052043]|uniref:DUF397 domain-containing protein n=1 Tax=Streptomyces sp. NPDC052043 TaxID=3365684 RepID=UPI0037D98159